MALYAQEAYCLHDKLGRIVDGIYAYTFPDSSQTHQISTYFKGREIQFDSWKKRQDVLIPYLLAEGAFVDRWWYKKFTTKLEMVEQNLKSPEEILLDKLSVFVKNSEYKGWIYCFTGHDEGGIWALLTAISFKRKYPHINVEVITFGQPRIGNYQFARFVDEWLISYRVTHADDTIPSFPKEYRGEKYRHHREEYWIPLDECECKFRVVAFECYSESGQENPECNAQFHETRNLQGRFSHYGPYFGYIMGRCPYEGSSSKTWPISPELN